MRVLKCVQEFVSCGHRYARKDWSREKNLKTYGEDYSDEGMGHNLGISACGSKDVQVPLRELCEILDHRFLNEIMGDVVPTTEALARYGFERIFEKIKVSKLEWVRVQEGDHLWAEYNRHHQSSLTKTYYLNCLHQHQNPHLSDEENRTLFGKCSRVHGHEYRVEITLTGQMDRETYLICQRQWMDDWVNCWLIQPFHKSFLNEFMENASGEIITQKFYHILKSDLPTRLQLSLCLRETRKNSFFMRDWPESQGPSPLCRSHLQERQNQR